MLKDKIVSTKECFAEAFSIPKDVALNATLVHIIGRSDVVIENYKGIICYNSKEIVVKGYNNKVSIIGDGLQIEYYAGEDMKVRGRINDIKYE